MAGLCRGEGIKTGTKLVPRFVGKYLQAFANAFAHPELFAQFVTQFSRQEDSALGIQRMSVFAEEHTSASFYSNFQSWEFNGKTVF
jgi:hypothetical protein